MASILQVVQMRSDVVDGIERFRKKAEFKVFEGRNPASDYSGSIGKSRVTVGRFSYGIDNFKVLQWGEGAAFSVGRFCSIAKNVTVFLGGNHRTDWISTFPFGFMFTEQLGSEKFEGLPSSRGDVVIGNDVWIGDGATIMSGVTIGDGAVVAANSHVVKNVAPYSIVGGNPAVLIRNRFPQSTIEKLLTLKWWDLPTEDVRQLAPQLSGSPAEEDLSHLIIHYRRTATPSA
jgi:acetyltransferase-like isoleucine patch superfamily enzyme